jgi:hypothetical protein
MMLGWHGAVMLGSIRTKVLFRGGDTVPGTHMPTNSRLNLPSTFIAFTERLA